MFKKHTTCNANSSNILFLVVSGLSTPVEMKLKLIPIFRHMHYDLQLTTKVSRSTFKDIITSSIIINFPLQYLYLESTIFVIINKFHCKLEPGYAYIKVRILPNFLSCLHKASTCM